MSTKKPKEQRKVMLKLKTALSSDEKSEMGMELATLNQERQQLEATKKEVAAEYTAKIKRCDSLITEKATMLGNGFEMREVTCTKTFDSPRKGWVQTHRNDNGEKVEERPMTPEESQSLMPLGDNVVPMKPAKKSSRKENKELKDKETPPEASQEAPKPDTPDPADATGEQESGVSDQDEEGIDPPEV